MKNRLLSILSLFALALPAPAVDVILTGGCALRSWEQYRGKQLAHDNWWANFVRASTIRMTHIRRQRPDAAITWIVYRPSYQLRGREDGKPYVTWIADLARKYKARLVWVRTKEEAIRALNAAPHGKGDYVSSFYYFGHSNPHAFMLEYSSEILAVSTQYIHETDLETINPAIFRPTSDCRSYGCFTGMSMTGWWKRIVGVPLWGNMKSTYYAPVSEGLLPRGGGRWVK